jgi:hypothetical protein
MELTNESIPKFIILSFSSLILYELIIIFQYIINVKEKTKFENTVLIFIIIKYFINILFLIYINRIYIKKMKEYNYYNFIKLSAFIFNIWIIHIFIHFRKCGIFRPVIFIEFILFSLLCFIILLTFFNTLRIGSENIHQSNNDDVIIVIPQIALPANNIEATNIQLPQARQLNININNRL